MHLTHHTDFSLRVLIYLSLLENDALVNIDEVAKDFKILKNHLTKVVQHLAQHGYIKTVRGKNGGMSLARSPDKMSLGDIIQTMENNTEVINCKEPACPLINKCDLKGILNEAQNAFFSTLDKYSLADISKQPQQIKDLLNLSA